jgi:recombination protein RecT
MTEEKPEPNQLAPSPRRTIRELLQGEDFRRQIALVLPKHLTPQRFIRVALNATLKTPKLLDCSRESLFKCLLELSAIGLEPDNKRAYLVPFGKECTLLVGYQGLAELVRRSGEVAKIEAHEVCERDEFDFRFGSRGILDHKPALWSRGKIIAVYSFVTLKDRTESFDVMGIEEIEKVRRRSKTPDAGPWVTDFAEMAKKTIFRRHSKFLPLSGETREAIEADDDFEPLSEQERFSHATPAQVLGHSKEQGEDSPRRRVGRPPKPPVQTEEKDVTEPEKSDVTSDLDELGKKATENVHQALVASVLTQLAVAGETADRFLTILRSVHLIGEEIKTVDAVPEETLRTALGDWSNVCAHLEALPK